MESAQGHKECAEPTSMIGSCLCINQIQYQVLSASVKWRQVWCNHSIEALDQVHMNLVTQIDCTSKNLQQEWYSWLDGCTDTCDPN